jgi:putative lipoic acid-binding regulatory protein
MPLPSGLSWSYGLFFGNIVPIIKVLKSLFYVLYSLLYNLKSKTYICLYFYLRMSDDNEKKAAEFYERLKAELDNSNSWPAPYLFKFIVPTNEDNILKVENAFNCMGAVIKTTKSKTGKFTSISVDVTVKDSQEIIDKYQELSTIEGIVSL